MRPVTVSPCHHPSFFELLPKMWEDESKRERWRGRERGGERVERVSIIPVRCKTCGLLWFPLDGTSYFILQMITCWPAPSSSRPAWWTRSHFSLWLVSIILPFPWPAFNQPQDFKWFKMVLVVDRKGVGTKRVFTMVCRIILDQYTSEIIVKAVFVLPLFCLLFSSTSLLPSLQRLFFLSSTSLLPLFDVSSGL